MKTRFPLNNWVSISKTRSIKKCVLCEEEIGTIGVVIYLRHEKLNLYNWVHLNCVDKLKDYKPKKDSIFNPEKYDYGCSYCGKIDNVPLHQIGHFCVHPHCINMLMQEIRQKYIDNEAIIIANAL